MKTKHGNSESNIKIQKIHIYNNNRNLQKNFSEGDFCLFFEPYYSEIKNCTKNNLFKSKPQTKKIIEVEYVNLPQINTNILQSTLAKKQEREEKEKIKIRPIKLIKQNNSKTNLPFFNNKKKETGELYAQVFLSSNPIMDENMKIRKYYISNLDKQISSYEENEKYNSLFNYRQMRNNPRKYTGNAVQRNDNILNDIRASNKYRECLFFNNLKKYIEPVDVTKNYNTSKANAIFKTKKTFQSNFSSKSKEILSLNKKYKLKTNESKSNQSNKRSEKNKIVEEESITSFIEERIEHDDDDDDEKKSKGKKSGKSDQKESKRRKTDKKESESGKSEKKESKSGKSENKENKSGKSDKKESKSGKNKSDKKESKSGKSDKKESKSGKSKSDKKDSKSNEEESKSEDKESKSDEEESKSDDKESKSDENESDKSDEEENKKSQKKKQK